jgi:maleylacetoacetate isomerase
MKLVLHNYWRSSASHRVRIGLGLKELAFEYVAVNIVKGEQFTEDYRAKNPMAQVPTLEIIGDDGRRIVLTQSLPILEYLDERWPELPILPRDPYLRAKARALAEIVNAGIQPLQNTRVTRQIKALGGDDLAWVRRFITEGLTAFAGAAAETAAVFCVGDAPTIADCCLVPQLGAARRYGVELDASFDRLLAIEARCLALPAFARAMPEHQPDAVTS